MLIRNPEAIEAELRRRMTVTDSIDSFELGVRRVDFMLSPIEIVDREEFEAGLLAPASVRADVTRATVDPSTGFLRLDARLTRVGVFLYSDREGNVWGELRDESEVFNPDSMKSFELVVLTDDHPEDFVQTKNVRDVQVGHVGTDVRRDGDFLRASILITDADMIRKIKDGKLELSCGYTAAVRLERGTRDGLEFRVRQLRIRGNHVAVVDRGRAGPLCRFLLDRADAFTCWEDPSHEDRNMEEIEIAPGVEVKMTKDQADAWRTAEEKKNDKLAELEAKTKKVDAAMFGEEEEEEEEDSASKPKPKPKNDAASTELEKLRGKNDALEAEIAAMRSGESTRIDARVNLVRMAGAILGPDFKTDGVSSMSIKRAIVVAVQPDMKPKLDSNKSEGYLDGLYEGALAVHGRKDAAAEANNAVIFGAMFGNGREDQLPDPVAEHAAYLDRHRNGWKSRPQPNEAPKEGV